jgi:putative transposase
MGSQWRAPDQTELWPHSTAQDRFQTWVEAGVFLTLWKAGVEWFDEAQGTLVGLIGDGRSDHQSAAVLGKNRVRVSPADAESGAKRSLKTLGHGIPIGLVAEGANRHDMKLVRTTVESLIVERLKPTTERPQGMCLDAGYDYMRSMRC